LSAKRFTVLVIPEGSHRVRRFRLRRGLMWTVSGSFLVLLAALGLLLTSYLHNNLDRAELTRLRSENLARQEHLRSLAADLDGLHQEMVVLRQNDAKVRVMAKLVHPPSHALAGTGGPQEVDGPADFSNLQRQIDQLRQSIDLRRESVEEIQGLLNDRRSLRGAKPAGWPVKGWVTSGFGMRVSPFSGHREMHPGLDIAARIGTPVHATVDGVVSRAEPTVGGYGKLVVIDSGYGYKTYYAHNSRIFVKVGQRVKRGKVISAVGDTGRSTGPHCHYEVRVNGVPVNPRKYL
jgi:septal ring factor EnvC (AmiA/AmiB activator)